MLLFPDNHAADHSHPYAFMRILAIVPCYNEALSLINTIDGLKEKVPFIDFIVVDDGSEDNTRTLCVENGYPVISLPFNLGLAAAVQTGMRYAFINGYDMAMQFDGDGQHLPEYISDMVRLMIETSADIVVGSRYITRRKRGLRGAGSLYLKLAVKITTGKTLTDPTSGLRLYNRSMIKILAQQINCGPEPDTLVFLMNRGAKVLETPVTMQPRAVGKSYLNVIGAFNYMARMLVSIMIVQWFRMKGKV
jgi:glycosyltransferase involved in cell wall biosynthesis